MLGAFSPCSDTMFSEENPFVADFNCSSRNSVKLGDDFLSVLPSFSAMQMTEMFKVFPQIYENDTDQSLFELTGIGGFEDGGFERRVEPAEGELGTMSSHRWRWIRWWRECKVKWSDGRHCWRWFRKQWCLCWLWNACSSSSTIKCDRNGKQKKRKKRE